MIEPYYSEPGITIYHLTSRNNVINCDVWTKKHLKGLGVTGHGSEERTCQNASLGLRLATSKPKSTLKSESGLDQTTTHGKAVRFQKRADEQERADSIKTLVRASTAEKKSPKFITSMATLQTIRQEMLSHCAADVTCSQMEGWTNLSSSQSEISQEQSRFVGSNIFCEIAVRRLRQEVLAL